MQIVEFIAQGTPISQQAKSKSHRRNWSEVVQDAARAALSSTHFVSTEPLRVTILYGYIKTETDLDNILKPILDSMKGIVYADDAVVVTIRAAKRDVTGSFNLKGVSPLLIAQLQSDMNGDFVFVSVEQEDQETLA